MYCVWFCVCCPGSVTVLVWDEMKFINLFHVKCIFTIKCTHVASKFQCFHEIHFFFFSFHLFFFYFFHETFAWFCWARRFYPLFLFISCNFCRFIYRIQFVTSSLINCTVVVSKLILVPGFVSVFHFFGHCLLHSRNMPIHQIYTPNTQTNKPKSHCCTL